MLANSRSHATIPVSDLDQAKAFYEGVLGLSPLDVPARAGVFYGTGEGTRFFVFPSTGRASGNHTQLGFVVTDLPAMVAGLKARGAVFETYAMPQFDADAGYATFPGSRSAWLKDPDGNLIGMVEFTES
jgi:catechol 2,3-dioxygenase-like lactoylglutathione lyase family enzyme